MHKFWKSFIPVLGMCCLVLVSTSSVNTVFAQGYKTPLPRGFGKYMVLIGKGDYLSPDGSAFRDGLIEGDGLHFQMNILGRDEEEIEQSRQEAVAFFAERFGLDAIHDVGNLYFTGFQLDPRIDLRVYTATHERVPAEGWQTFAGGWVTFVTNPSGVTLGGEFEGTHVGAGTVFAVVELKIIRDGDKDPLIVQRHTFNPSVPFPGVDGAFSFLVADDELYNEEYGAGVFMGMSSLAAVGEDGFVKYRSNAWLHFNTRR